MISFDGIPEIEEELKQVNRHLERLCQSNSDSMQKMMDWILQSRGKQIRSIMTLLCSKLKGRKADATETAAVIEMCHTASLVHDDIIDNADLRRGQLSVQKKFGREMAVYAGDFLIFATIARTGLMNKLWYRTMFAKLEHMCDGEVSQLDNHFNTSINEEQCLNNIIGKTSAMFVIACGAGAYEGKCNAKERADIQAFGENFGLLFQLRDDLMDFVCSDVESQKSIHNDFWCGYYTVPAIHTFGHPVYGPELKKIAQDLKNGIQGEDVDDRISDLIQKADGYNYTLSMIEGYAEKAKRNLDGFRDSAAKAKLIEIVDVFLESAKNFPIPS